MELWQLYVYVSLLFDLESVAFSDEVKQAKAYFPPDQSSGSPTEMLSLDSPKALDPKSTLERFTSILASLDPSIQASGKYVRVFFL